MADLLRCVDLHGRTVVLTVECWLYHILPDRAILSGQEQGICATVEGPTYIMRDVVHPNRECFYRFGAIPGALADHYLKVVVEYDVVGPGGLTVGTVVTAYPTDRLKSKEQRLWPT